MVSVQINHIIGDMYSMCTFLNAWATKCRQIAEEIECPDFNLASLLPPKEDLESLPVIVREQGSSSKLGKEEFDTTEIRVQKRMFIKTKSRDSDHHRKRT